MHLCHSALLSFAFTITLTLFELAYKQYTASLVHFILGSIISFFFFALCHMGKEVVNWVFITIFIIISLSSWLIYTAQTIQNKQIDIYNRSQCNELVTTITPPPPPTPTPPPPPTPTPTPPPSCKAPPVKKCCKTCC
jgi:hypothetical protein